MTPTQTSPESARDDALFDYLGGEAVALEAQGLLGAFHVLCARDPQAAAEAGARLARLAFDRIEGVITLHVLFEPTGRGPFAPSARLQFEQQAFIPRDTLSRLDRTMVAPIVQVISPRANPGDMTEWRHRNLDMFHEAPIDPLSGHERIALLEEFEMAKRVYEARLHFARMQDEA